MCWVLMYFIYEIDQANDSGAVSPGQWSAYKLIRSSSTAAQICAHACIQYKGAGQCRQSLECLEFRIQNLADVATARLSCHEISWHEVCSALHTSIALEVEHGEACTQIEGAVRGKLQRGSSMVLHNILQTRACLFGPLCQICQLLAAH